MTGGIYIAVVGALLYALGAAGMGATDLPFSLVLAKLGGPATGTIVAGIAMLIVVSCANTNIMSAPRFLYALTEDGLLPAAVSRVNKGGTPDVALAMTAVATTALTLTGSFDLAFGLIATLAAASFIFCYSAFFVLRWREPELHRPFRAIGYPVLPAISLFIAVASFTLYMSANPFGAVYAVGLWAACIPLAMLARRARRLPRPSTDRPGGDGPILPKIVEIWPGPLEWRARGTIRGAGSAGPLRPIGARRRRLIRNRKGSP